MNATSTKVLCQYAGCARGENGQPRSFSPRPGKANKYCSQECYWSAKEGVSIKGTETYEKSFGHRTRKYYPHVCQNPDCRRVFEALTPHREYCSIPCSAAGRSLKLKGRHVTIKKPRRSLVTGVGRSRPKSNRPPERIVLKRVTITN